MTRTHRFRPRYRGMAWSAIGVAGAVSIAALALGPATTPLVIGAIGASFGLLYLGSPTWKLVVVTDDDGLEVKTQRATKFRLAWKDVVRVVASESTHTAFVDGGAPARSLLVPGDGAPAPYSIEDAAALVDTILAHVTPDRIERVESLDRATKPERPA
ncbi:MAG: hypothetical protein AB7T06_34100 [Kofleriaceae bacterium]